MQSTACTTRGQSLVVEEAAELRKVENAWVEDNAGWMIKGSQPTGTKL